MCWAVSAEQAVAGCGTVAVLLVSYMMAAKSSAGYWDSQLAGAHPPPTYGFSPVVL
jgi:hypothetical protein